VLGVEGRTPGYMIREEIQREKLTGRERGGGLLARLCLDEVGENIRKRKRLEGWEGERGQYFRDRGGRYWEGEKGKKWRLCGSGVESWEYVWEECRSWRVGLEREWQEVVDRILGDEGEEEGWMREVEEERRKVEERVEVRVNEGVNEKEREGERGRVYGE
ncbi:hypothetical protein ALC57_14712, partial [Trachymyrmex cornetzi]